MHINPGDQGRLALSETKVHDAGMTLLNSNQTALLAALMDGQQRYGLELADRVRDRTNGDVVLGQGTLYPALRALERDGFVTSAEGPPMPERGGRPRVFYKITGEGRQAAEQQRSSWAGLFDLQAMPLSGGSQ